MKSGMLLFDNSKKPVDEKVLAAAGRYREKYGLSPNVVFLNPLDDPATLFVGGIKVGIKSTIMPSHIWLGIQVPEPQPFECNSIIVSAV